MKHIELTSKLAKYQRRVELIEKRARRELVEARMDLFKSQGRWATLIVRNKDTGELMLARPGVDSGSVWLDPVDAKSVPRQLLNFEILAHRLEKGEARKLSKVGSAK